MESKTILTETEIEQLTALQAKTVDIYQQLGQTEYQITVLMHSKSKLQEHLQDYITQQEELSKTLSEKYGEGSVNIETGEFTPFS